MIQAAIIWNHEGEKHTEERKMEKSEGGTELRNGGDAV